jgi:hypothetical protein
MPVIKGAKGTSMSSWSNAMKSRTRYTGPYMPVVKGAKGTSMSSWGLHGAINVRQYVWTFCVYFCALVICLVLSI